MRSLKNQNNKYFSVIFLALLIFLLSSDFCFAFKVGDLEVKLPGLPANPGLEDYIATIFSLVMGLAGAIAVLAFIIGAIGYMASAGDPNARTEGISRMKSAILGVILLLSSFLILKTINLKLIDLELPPFGDEVPGLFLIGGKDKKPCPLMLPDSSLLPQNLKTISYECYIPAGGNIKEVRADWPPLWVFKYPEKNFGGKNNMEVVDLECGGTTGVSQSFQIVFRTPGLYLYLQPGCKGEGMGPIIGNVPELPEAYKNKVKSIRIINDPAKGTYYGAVLHQEINFRGECSSIIGYGIGGSNLPPSSCSGDAPDFGSSLTVFKPNPKNWTTSGDGVALFSQPFGFRAGFIDIKNDKIKEYYTNRASLLVFDYEGSGVSEEEQWRCCSPETRPAPDFEPGAMPKCDATFKECPGSIKVKGNYLVVLYASTDPKKEGRYCQIFTKDAPNLKAEWLIEREKRGLTSIKIIPTIK